MHVQYIFKKIFYVIFKFFKTQSLTDYKKIHLLMEGWRDQYFQNKYFKRIKRCQRKRKLAEKN